MCTHEVDNHAIPVGRIHCAKTGDIWSFFSSDLIPRGVDLFAKKKKKRSARHRRRFGAIAVAAYAYYVGLPATYRLLNVGDRSSQGSYSRILQKLRDVDPCI